jgi:predicted ATPase/DNA-binding NarL/FixJ family response regulator
VAAVCALLRREDARLINLIGPGGVGKTRLALAVVAEVAADFDGGVHLVSLAAIHDPGLVVPVIARALGVYETRDQPLVDQLVRALGSRAALLVLDSVERVAEAAPLLTDLLAACPNLKILVTSRRVLHLSAEHLSPVPPLAVPPPTADVTVEQFSELDAVRLFALRARAASVGFMLTAENAPVVAEICRRLDGLPLAIELAAARVRFFPPAAILDRLERRLPLLTGGPSDAPARHRTLTDTITWSYDLLGESERLLFRRLSVFVGGIPWDAAEQMAVDGDDGFVALLDHSLVHPIASVGAESRFAMLDVVREFAGDRLEESGEAEEIRRRHAAWCEALVDSAQAALGSALQQRWLIQLDAEHDNLRAAMRRAKRSGNAEALARLAGGLWRFWYGRGYLTEGRRWLLEALALANDVPARDRLQLLLGIAALAHAQGQGERAVAFLDEGLALAQREEDRHGLALALNLLGVVARDRGEYDRAVASLEESLAHFRALDDSWGIALTINSLAVLLQRRGQYDRTAEMLKESADLASARGDQWGTAQALSNMAHLAHRQGRFQHAADLYERSVDLYRVIGDRRGESDSLTNLGRIAERLGDPERAIALHQQSLVATRQLGDRRGTATTLSNLAVAYLRRGDPDEAERAGREGLVLRQQMGDQEGIATSLERLAEVAVARKQVERAVRLWAAAAALRDVIGAPLAPAERASYDVIATAARSALPGDRYSAVWAAGRALSAPEAVDEALRDDVVTSPAPLSEARRAATPGITLSPRELDVLRLLDEHSDREIADRLSIGPRTVSTHVTNIMNKFGVNSRTAAVAYAIRHGLV